MNPLKLIGTPIPASDREKLGVVTGPFRNMLVTIVYRPLPNLEEESRYMHIELTPNRKWELSYIYWSHSNKGPVERIVTIKYDNFVGCGWSAHSQFPNPNKPLNLFDLASFHVGGIFGNMDASLLITVVGIQERAHDVYLGPNGEEGVFQSVHEYNPFEDESKIDKTGPHKVIPAPNRVFKQIEYYMNKLISIREVEIARTDELGAEFAFIKEPNMELLGLVPIFLFVVNNEGDNDNNGEAGDEAKPNPNQGEEFPQPEWYETPD